MRWSTINICVEVTHSIRPYYYWQLCIEHNLTESNNAWMPNTLTFPQVNVSNSSKTKAVLALSFLLFVTRELVWWDESNLKKWIWLFAWLSREEKDEEKHNLILNGSSACKTEDACNASIRKSGRRLQCLHFVHGCMESSSSLSHLAIEWICVLNSSCLSFCWFCSKVDEFIHVYMSTD